MENVDSHRTEIIGIAVILILCVHFTSIAHIPEVLRKILGIGSSGIYIFAFLSGRGLTKSLINNQSINLKEFYYRRFMKVGLPYLLISAIWLTIRWIIIEFKPLDFAMDISTISFWTSHRGAWYVAFLIPVYIIFPIYNKWVSINNRRNYYVLIGILLLQYALFSLNIKLYQHVSQVLSALCAVVLGTYSVHIEGKKKTEKVCLAILIILGAMIFIPFIKNEFTSGLSMVAVGILLSIVAGIIFSKFVLIPIEQLLRFLGKISLEMYLCNIYLLQAYVLMKNNVINVNANVAYLFVIILGTMLANVFSIVVHHFRQLCVRRGNKEVS